MRRTQLLFYIPTLVVGIFVTGTVIGNSREEIELSYPHLQEDNLAHITVDTEPPPLKVFPTAIDVVVVNPFRSANVGSQVGGLITRFNFDEGDFVEEGQTVCELDSTRYKYALDRAQERVNELRAALDRATEEAEIKGELLDLSVTTRMEAAKARTELDMAQFRLAGAERELDIARFDYDACKVKAPFSGYISARGKQQDESVERLATIFSIVDSSRVYAVANVPVVMLTNFRKGAHADFIYGKNMKVSGVIDRVAKLIDPKSKTKRVYLLIDNGDGNLEVGMTGSLNPVN